MDERKELSEEEEAEKLIDILREDKKIINEMKMENERIKKVNKRLREKLSEVIKEVKDLKDVEEEEHKYSFDKGWKDKTELQAERISEVEPEEIEKQIEEITKLVREMKNNG